MGGATKKVARVGTGIMSGGLSEVGIRSGLISNPFGGGGGPRTPDDLFGNQVEEARKLEQDLKGADIPEAEKKRLLEQLRTPIDADFNIGGSLINAPGLNQKMRLSYDINATQSIKDRLNKLAKVSARSAAFERKLVAAKTDQPGQIQSMLTSSNTSLLGKR